MSNQYFTGNPDVPGTQQMAGYAPAQERSYGFGEPFDAGRETADFRDGHGQQYQQYPQYQQFPPQVDPRPAQPKARALQHRPMVVMAVLAAAVVGLGGYSVMSQVSLGAIQAKADGLTESLSSAEDTLADKETELKQIEQKLDASSKASASAKAKAEAATSCATYLYDAWAAYFSEDLKAAQAALDAAQEPCDAALSDGSGK